MRLSVTDNIDKVIRECRDIARVHVPKATADALTKTLAAVRRAENEEVKRVFDRPAPFTERGTLYKPAKVGDLTAKLWLKERFDVGKGNAPADYLQAQIEGGPRKHKRFELALIAQGIMPKDMYAVPGDRVRLDRFGNIPAGTIVQILSALGAAERTAGYLANRTARSARRKKRPEWFVGRPGNGKGPLGIWQRVGGGARPIIIFVKQPTYRRRYDFHGIANRVAAEQFEPLFNQTLADALRKA